MSAGDDQRIDPTLSCSRCDAVCCRQTVVVMPEDRGVPRHMVERTPEGLDVMAHDEDGWCVAIDQKHMHCSIYEQRPGICRSFVMGSRDCRLVREAYARRHDGDDSTAGIGTV